jgi:hypothetical protein
MSWPSPSTTYTPEYLAVDISGRLQATCITFLILETTFIALMWTSRWCARKERKNIAIEIFMTLTWVVCCGKIAVALRTFTHSTTPTTPTKANPSRTVMIHLGGTGHHTAALDPLQRANGLKLAAASQVICPMTTSFSKLGVLLFLSRILRQSGRRYRIAIWTTFALVCVTMLAQVLLPFINCRPFKKTWLPREPGTCSIEILSLYRYAGLPNVLTTLMVIAIPVPVLAKLHVVRAVKYGLGVVFAICIVGVVAAFMRTYSFLMVIDFRDVTYENVRPMCWIVAESGIYLIGGVMLTLRPLVSGMCKGTRMEKFWTVAGSRSWGSRRFSRGLRQRNGAVVEIAAEKGGSFESEKGEMKEVVVREAERAYQRGVQRF